MQERPVLEVSLVIRDNLVNADLPPCKARFPIPVTSDRLLKKPGLVKVEHASNVLVIDMLPQEGARPEPLHVAFGDQRDL